MKPSRFTPLRGWALLVLLLGLLLLFRFVLLTIYDQSLLVTPTAVVITTPTITATPRITATRILTGTFGPAFTPVPRTALEPGAPPTPTATLAPPTATASSIPASATPSAVPALPTDTVPLPATAEQSPPVPPSTPTPTVTPTATPTRRPTPMGGPRLINNEIDPPWWPCRQGQIKATQKLGVYHTPEQPGYTRVFVGVECFDTEQAAQSAGYSRAQ